MAGRSDEALLATLQEGGMYTTIENCIAGPGVRLETAESAPLYEGCKCRGNCVSRTCSCVHAYDKDGRLREEYFFASSRPMFECNALCRCAVACPNRSIQRPPPISLQVFRTEEKGYGVKTVCHVAIGTYVGEYVGEIVTNSEAKRRLKQSSRAGPCYIVMYREHGHQGVTLTTSVDATHYGNITRFVNHSCSPNVAMLPVRVDSIIPKLCLFACEDISPGEEVCFSYFGCSSLQLGEQRGDVQLGGKACLCGSRHCLRRLPLEL